MNSSTPNVSAGPRTRRSGPPLVGPLGILLVLTVVVRLFDLDLKIAQAVYQDGEWPWDANLFIRCLYLYGTWPAITVASVAGAFVVLSLWLRRWGESQLLAAFLALSMLVGPGLLVNAGFKEYYGRPRPREIKQFGGEREFAPVWQPNIGKGGKSFPSGHASMGFYWLCLAVFFCERSRHWTITFIVLGLGHGTAMGFGRIVQGGHWFSDILWAFGMVYLSAWFLYRVLPFAPASSGPVPDERKP